MYIKMVYFIGNKEMDICKIGFSRRPYRRIETLRKKSLFELEIFDIVEGTAFEEKMYHNMYFEHRIKGEWFKLSKVTEIGFGNTIREVKIGSITLNVNENNYIHLPSLLANLNKERINNLKCPINFGSWKVSNDSFMKTIDNPIVKETCLWIHRYVAFELIRCSSTKNKIMLYEYMYDISKGMKDTNAIVRLAIDENK